MCVDLLVRAGVNLLPPLAATFLAPEDNPASNKDNRVKYNTVQGRKLLSISYIYNIYFPYFTVCFWPGGQLLKRLLCFLANI